METGEERGIIVIFVELPEFDGIVEEIWTVGAFASKQGASPEKVRKHFYLLNIG